MVQAVKVDNTGDVEAMSAGRGLWLCISASFARCQWLVLAAVVYPFFSRIEGELFSFLFGRKALLVSRSERRSEPS